jgi:hypothetical protein
MTTIARITSTLIIALVAAMGWAWSARVSRWIDRLDQAVGR